MRNLAILTGVLALPVAGCTMPPVASETALAGVYGAYMAATVLVNRLVSAPERESYMRVLDTALELYTAAREARRTGDMQAYSTALLEATKLIEQVVALVRSR